MCGSFVQLQRRTMRRENTKRNRFFAIKSSTMVNATSLAELTAFIPHSLRRPLSQVEQMVEDARIYILRFRGR